MGYEHSGLCIMPLTVINIGFAFMDFFSWNVHQKIQFIDSPDHFQIVFKDCMRNEYFDLIQNKEISTDNCFFPMYIFTLILGLLYIPLNFIWAVIVPTVVLSSPIRNIIRYNKQTRQILATRKHMWYSVTTTFNPRTFNPIEPLPYFNVIPEKRVIRRVNIQTFSADVIVFHVNIAQTELLEFSTFSDQGALFEQMHLAIETGNTAIHLAATNTDMPPLRI